MNLDTDNGPDLRVYLVAGPVSEGGEPSVSIWCRAFSVSFGMAQLQPS